MKRRESIQLPVEMPMGPMIDMVFLLLVFFLISARPQPQEKEISLSLPGTVSQDQSVDLPEELQIVIEPNGQVLLNDLAIDERDSRAMPTLLATLIRFRESAAANRISSYVVLNVADDASYQRIIDVLNACATAQITSVTFAQSDEDM